MHQQGLGLKSIVNELHRRAVPARSNAAWNKDKVYRILRNTLYIGEFFWAAEDFRVKMLHQSIIDKEAFFATQVLFAERKPDIQHPRRVQSPYLLSGLLFCEKCDLRFLGVSAKNSKYFYYACQTFRKKSKGACEQHVSKDVVDKAILQMLSGFVYTGDNMISKVRAINSELTQKKLESTNRLAQIEQNLSNLKPRLCRLYDSLETGSVEAADIAEPLRRLKSEIDLNSAEQKELLDQTRHPEIATSVGRGDRRHS